MKFQVVWLPDSEAEFTRLWLGGRDREALQEAATRIDEQLASDPWNAGESRSGNERIVFNGPLAVSFAVIASEQEVRVFHVSRTRLPRR